VIAKLSRRVAKWLAGQREIVRRRLALASGLTDYRRWSDSASYRASWASRLEVSLRLRGDALWIVDLGCGAQIMRTKLPRNAVYLPMDLIRWTDDTLLCDINKQQLPADYLRLCDLCYVMGVIEYIYDPAWVLRALVDSSQGIVISYNAVDLSDVNRKWNGWVNDLTVEDLMALVRDSGFEIQAVAQFEEQIIVKASNANYSVTRRQERELLRESFLRDQRP